MARYILKTNRNDWPPEIPIRDGEYGMDYDVIESEIPDEWKEWLRNMRERGEKLAEKSAGRKATKEEKQRLAMRPIGFNWKNIPGSMEIIDEPLREQGR